MALDEKTKQGMESGFDHAVRVVQRRFTHFEQKFFAPCLEYARCFSDRRPIASILIIIFSLLSFLPVASFMGFAILVIAAFVSVGLGCAFIASTILIVTAGGVLTFVLGALLLASIFLTCAVVTLFIILRLIQHLASRGDLKNGILGWSHEIQSRLGWSAAEPNGSLITNGGHVKKEASASAVSDEWQPVSGSDGRT